MNRLLILFSPFFSLYLYKTVIISFLSITQNYLLLLGLDRRRWFARGALAVEVFRHDSELIFRVRLEICERREREGERREKKNYLLRSVKEENEKVSEGRDKTKERARNGIQRTQKEWEQIVIGSSNSKYGKV